ncbi:MAG: hypothetical protein ACOX3G_00790 [Armatimonadota bacterium]
MSQHYGVGESMAVIPSLHATEAVIDCHETWSFSVTIRHSTRSRGIYGKQAMLADDWSGHTKAYKRYLIMRDEANENRRRGRRVWMSRGRLVTTAIVLLLGVWLISGFFMWKQSRIPLPDGSGSVIYMARLRKIFCAQWNRKVRLETSHFKGQTRWIPGDSGGAWPVNVYWYAQEGNSGPYLRFHDPDSEYLVDLQQGITLLMLRNNHGGIDVVEIFSASPRMGSIVNPMSGEEIRTVDGHRARKLGGRVASGQGIYIGRIEYPYNRFIPKQNAPEQALPKH